jgi:hypothetical protein
MSRTAHHKSQKHARFRRGQSWNGSESKIQIVQKLRRLKRGPIENLPYLEPVVPINSKFI